MGTSTALTTIPAGHPAINNKARNPIHVYLSGLSKGSRRTMGESLSIIGELLTGQPVDDPAALPWWTLTYSHTAALRSRLAERYSASTANKILSALRGALRECWRLGYLDAETLARAVDLKPVKGTSAPKGRAVDIGEITSLVRACAKDRGPLGARDTGLIAALYALGLRRSEATALDLADHDPDSGAVTIRHAKGNKARVVYARNGAAAALNHWRAVRGNVPGPLFIRIRRGGHMLPDRLTDQAVLTILRKRAAQAGVKQFSPHDLRRSHAGEMLDAGVDLVTLQRMMGHANPATTARYDRRDDRARQAAAAKIPFPHVA